MDIKIPYVNKIVPETSTSFVVVNPKGLLTPDLLLHMDLSTGFRDSSIRNHPITINGSPSISTAQSIFGGASGFFQSSGPDYLAITADIDGCLSFGTGDFTIDFRLQPTIIGVNQHCISNNPTTTPTFAIGFTNFGNVYYAVTALGSIVQSTTPVVNNTWFHIAVTRQAGNIRLFINGTQEGGTVRDDASYNYAGTDFRIADGGFETDGYFDEVRVIKGYAAWTSNFTPPTAPYNTIA